MYSNQLSIFLLHEFLSFDKSIFFNQILFFTEICIHDAVTKTSNFIFSVVYFNWFLSIYKHVRVNFLSFFFHWTIVALQCCSSFCYTIVHIHISPLPWISSPFRALQSISRFLYAIQSVLISFLFYTQYCVYASFQRL